MPAAADGEGEGDGVGDGVADGDGATEGDGGAVGDGDDAVTGGDDPAGALHAARTPMTLNAAAKTPTAELMGALVDRPCRSGCTLGAGRCVADCPATAE